MELLLVSLLSGPMCELLCRARAELFSFRQHVFWKLREWPRAVSRHPDTSYLVAAKRRRSDTSVM